VSSRANPAPRREPRPVATFFVSLGVSAAFRVLDHLVVELAVIRV